MKLYHGSYVAVERPDVLHSRRNVDFGPGFYLTPLIDQAKSWCDKQFRRRGQAVLSIYELDDEVWKDAKTLVFEDYSADWLSFVVSCRKMRDTTDYDVVMGGVANDRVFNTVELFFDGLIDFETAIDRLRYEMPNAQVCIRAQAIIDRYLHFKGSESLC